MKRTEINERLAMRAERVQAAREKKSTGENGKYFEILSRSFIKKKPFTSISDFRARVNYEAENDFTLVLNGKRYCFEFKTGAGEIAASETVGKSFFSEDDRYNPNNYLIGKDIVVYNPYPEDYVITCLDDIEKYRDNILDDSFVFTRKEFLDFITENSGKRKHSLFTATKFNHGCTRINIQSNYLKQIANALDGCEYPTFRTYLEDIERI